MKTIFGRPAWGNLRERKPYRCGLSSAAMLGLFLLIASCGVGSDSIGSILPRAESRGWQSGMEVREGHLHMDLLVSRNDVFVWDHVCDL